MPTSGNRLKKIRKELHLSQEEFGDKIGLSRAGIAAVEADKIEDEFHLLVQVANPKNQNDASSANQPQFVTYEASGQTLQQAFRNIVQESSRKIYGMHIQLLVITENIAKEDLQSMLDFFFRNVEIRKEFYVIVDT